MIDIGRYNIPGLVKYKFGLYWCFCPYHYVTKNKKKIFDRSLLIDSKSESYMCYICYENGLNISPLNERKEKK